MEKSGCLLSFSEISILDVEEDGENTRLRTLTDCYFAATTLEF